MSNNFCYWLCWCVLLHIFSEHTLGVLLVYPKYGRVDKLSRGAIDRRRCKLFSVNHGIKTLALLLHGKAPNANISRANINISSSSFCRLYFSHSVTFISCILSTAFLSVCQTIIHDFQHCNFKCHQTSFESPYHISCDNYHHLINMSPSWSVSTLRAKNQYWARINIQFGSLAIMGS